MAETLTLMEFIRELLFNDEARAEFAENPERELAEHGLEDLSPADVHDALVLVSDNQTADFSRDYNTGGNNVGNVALTPPPPPPVHHNNGDHDGGGHQDAITYLNNYVTNNFVDDRDTITDNSINQQIDTGGGDFDQDIDVESVVASGEGSVAAGEDIEDSTIVTGNDNTVGDGNVDGDGNLVGNNNDGNLVGDGDGNVVGDHNQAVTGNENTTSFGDGDATSVDVGGNLNVGDGSAFGVGGDAEVDNTDNSVNVEGNDFSDNSVNDSGNDSSDNSVNDSFNEDVDVDIEDSGNDNSDNSINDSGNDNSVSQELAIDA